MNDTIDKLMKLKKPLNKDKVEEMKWKNIIELAVRKQAPDWLKEMIKEDDARITKH